MDKSQTAKRPEKGTEKLREEAIHEGTMSIDEVMFVILKDFRTIATIDIITSTYSMHSLSSNIYQFLELQTYSI